jgi:hypothetical protein
MGNLQDILFFANLLPGSLDLMMEYGKLRCNLKIQDLGNGNNISYMKTIPNHQEYVVASMFGKVDAKIISKIASHFGIEAKYFSISGGKLKVKTSLQDKDPYGMYSYNSMIKSRNTDPDIRGFVQATLFASYASAVAAGQAVSIDPNAQYACVVDLSDVTHRFGDAAPEERKYNGGGQIFFSDNPKGSEKGEKDGLGLRYKLEEYMSTNSFDSLIRPKKDLYSNFEKIIDKDYNIKINNYIFKKDWDPFGKKGL